ncbi:MAG: hypothetical protein ABUS54_14530 [Actinomycetota bacterium]
MTFASPFRGDVPRSWFGPLRHRCLAAYDRVEQLPRGPERRASWAAYALVTYGDKLIDTDGIDGATAEVAAAAYGLAAGCLEHGAVPGTMPHWSAGTRSEEQLRAMHETLADLNTFLAYDARDTSDTRVAARLAAIDARLSTVARLWVPRPTPELRGGIAGALVAGLDEAYVLGLDLAQPAPSSR